MPLSTDGSFLFLDPTCDHEGCLGVLCEVGTPEFSPPDRSPLTGYEIDLYVRTGYAPAWSAAAARDGSMQDLVIRLREGDRASFGYDRHEVGGPRVWTFEPRDGAQMLAGKTFPISDPARQAQRAIEVAAEWDYPVGAVTSTSRLAREERFLGWSYEHGNDPAVQEHVGDHHLAILSGPVPRERCLALGCPIGEEVL